MKIDYISLMHGAYNDTDRSTMRWKQMIFCLGGKGLRIPATWDNSSELKVPLLEFSSSNPSMFDNVLVGCTWCEQLSIQLSCIM